MTKAYENNKFRGDGNQWLTKSLFFETCVGDKDTVLYTLKKEDHLGYPSLYRLYMLCNDITEYKFATTYLDGWEHWKHLSQLYFLKDHVDEWREELMLRLQSESLGRIIADAKTTSNTSVASNKYLLEKGWVTKEDKKKERGRPSKTEIKRVAEEHFKSLDDFERLKAASKIQIG